MSDFSRRTMIGVAGATMAIAACSPARDGNGEDSASTDNEKGINDNWGEDPHKDAPDVKPAGGFKPIFACVAYIRFDSKGSAIIRHGYIETGGLRSGESEDQFALREAKLVEEMLATAATAVDWKASRAGYPRKEVNFEGFDFGQQMRVFVAIDNDGIKFDDRKTKGRYANLVRFTKYQTRPELPDFEPRLTNPNHGFFGATLVDLNVNGTVRQALRLDNWYVGPNAQEIKAGDPKTHQSFAMDFHLLWQASDTGGKIKAIPIVIDPDGGNVGSRP